VWQRVYPAVRDFAAVAGARQLSAAGSANSDLGFRGSEFLQAAAMLFLGVIASQARNLLFSGFLTKSRFLGQTPPSEGQIEEVCELLRPILLFRT
jgi:hypothetical protein